MKKKIIQHTDHVIIIKHSDGKQEGIDCIDNREKLVCSLKEREEK